MSELEFRILIPNRRLDDRARPPGDSGRRAASSGWLHGITRGMALLWSAVAVAAAYVAVGPPTAIINGTAVTARHILVVVDVSGSMKETEATLKNQLAQLERQGISASSRVDVSGFGVSMAGCRSNLLKALEAAAGEEPESVDPRNASFCAGWDRPFGVEAAVATGPSFDAVYVYSDFDRMDAPIDGSDPAGYERLRQLVNQHGFRIFLSTVRDTPDEELIRIAKAAGGDVISSQ